MEYARSRRDKRGIVASRNKTRRRGLYHRPGKKRRGDKMSNPNPHQITPEERGHRPALPPELRTEARAVSLTPAQWKRLESLAESLSSREEKTVTVQEVIRRIVKNGGNMNEVYAQVITGNLLQSLSEILSWEGIGVVFKKASK